MAIFSNQAALSYNGITTLSNIATGEIIEVLSATKTALVNTYTANGTVSYVVSINNTGTNEITGVTLTDNLGEYPYESGTLYPLDYVDGSARFFVNGNPVTGFTVSEGPPLTVTGLSVPGGGNGIFIYTARVNENAPLNTGSTITNTVTVNGADISAEATATETVSVAGEPILTVNKSMSPVSVSENGRLTYTFEIVNTGNAEADAGTNAVITDNIVPILSDVTVTYEGAPWTENVNYTYNETTGQFATLDGQINVPAATYTRNPATGAWETLPGSVVLTVSGTV